MISQPFSVAFCSISSRSRTPTRPPSTRRRYFGHHTTCSPRSYTPPEYRRTFRVTVTRSLYRRFTYSWNLTRFPHRLKPVVPSLPSTDGQTRKRTELGHQTRGSRPPPRP